MRLFQSYRQLLSCQRLHSIPTHMHIKHSQAGVGSSCAGHDCRPTTISGYPHPREAQQQRGRSNDGSEEGSHTPGLGKSTTTSTWQGTDKTSTSNNTVKRQGRGRDRALLARPAEAYDNSMTRSSPASSLLAPLNVSAYCSEYTSSCRSVDLDFAPPTGWARASASRYAVARSLAQSSRGAER